MRILLALVGATVAATGLAACSDDDEAATTVVRAEATAFDGRATTFQLPSGTLTVTVGDPLAGDVPAADARDGEDHDRPDDGVFLPVSWSFATLSDRPEMLLGLLPFKPLTVAVAPGLAASAINLPAPYEIQGNGIFAASDRAFYVPVGGDGRGASVSVTYDGLTQTLDTDSGEIDAGAARPLYDDADLTLRDIPDLPCPGARDVGPDRVQVTCRAFVVRSPYVAAKGWAPEGRSYVGLGWSVRGTAAGDVDGPGLRDGVASMTVDDAGPFSQPQGLGEPEIAWAGGTGVFEAPAEGGTATITYEVRGSDAVAQGTLRLALP